MDMTAWLDFVTGPETQRAEVRERSERVIRRDVLWCNSPASTCGRPRFWGIVGGHGKLTIQDFETLCPKVNRRSLQRDLKGMLDRRVVVEIGAGPTDRIRHWALAEL
jgi:hypothetical protein